MKKIGIIALVIVLAACAIVFAHESVKTVPKEETKIVRVYRKTNGDKEDFIRIEQNGYYDANPIITYGSGYTGPDHSGDRQKLVLPTKYNGSSSDCISIDVSGYYKASETVVE